MLGTYVIAQRAVMTPELELPDLVADALEQRGIWSGSANDTVINGRRAAALLVEYRGRGFIIVVATEADLHPPQHRRGPSGVMTMNELYLAVRLEGAFPVCLILRFRQQPARFYRRARSVPIWPRRVAIER